MGVPCCPRPRARRKKALVQGMRAGFGGGYARRVRGRGERGAVRRFRHRHGPEPGPPAVAAFAHHSHALRKRVPLPAIPTRREGLLARIARRPLLHARRPRQPGSPRSGTPGRAARGANRPPPRPRVHRPCTGRSAQRAARTAYPVPDQQLAARRRVDLTSRRPARCARPNRAPGKRASGAGRRLAQRAVAAPAAPGLSHRASDCATHQRPLWRVWQPLPESPFPEPDRAALQEGRRAGLGRDMSPASDADRTRIGRIGRPALNH